MRCAPNNAHFCHWSLLILRFSMTSITTLNMSKDVWLKWTVSKINQIWAPPNVCISNGHTTKMQINMKLINLVIPQWLYFLYKFEDFEWRQSNFWILVRTCDKCAFLSLVIANIKNFNGRLPKSECQQGSATNIECSWTRDNSTGQKHEYFHWKYNINGIPMKLRNHVCSNMLIFP